MKRLAKFASVLAVTLTLSLSHSPVRAETDGPDLFGGGDGKGDLMTKMAPMLETMKTKLGPKRFEQLMKTVGPLAVQMMGDGNGGFGDLGSLDFSGIDLGDLDLGGLDLNGITSLVPSGGGRRLHWRIR